MRMKLKLLLTAATIVGITAAAQAQEEEAVYSVNVVGFQKKELPDASQFDMYAAPFYTPGNTLIEIFGTNSLYGNNSAPLADRLRLWDPNQQIYINIGVAGNGRFYSQTADGNWVSPLDDVSEMPLFPYEGLWIASSSQAPSDRTMTFAGDVVMDEDILYPFHPGFHLIAYPFSSSIPLQEMAFEESGAAKNNSAPLADRIRVWDSDSQSYVNYGLAGNGTWYLQDADGNWVSPLVESTHVIQPGDSFFYFSQGSYTWEEENPYLLSVQE